jgi:cytochrome c oxidase cbb3-type subunit II
MSAAGYRVTAALVIAKDQRGRLHHIYHGDWIPWLNDGQRKHFPRLRLVEEINDEEAAVVVVELRPVPAADVVVNPDVVRECIAALDRCGVRREAGRPTAREALRDAGFRFGNDVISAAVRERKMRAS